MCGCWRPSAAQAPALGLCHGCDPGRTHLGTTPLQRIPQQPQQHIAGPVRTPAGCWRGHREVQTLPKAAARSLSVPQHPPQSQLPQGCLGTPGMGVHSMALGTTTRPQRGWKFWDSPSDQCHQWPKQGGSGPSDPLSSRSMGTAPAPLGSL